MNVLGIDFSSRAIDLVLVDENSDHAEWTRQILIGEDSFERTRDVVRVMPSAIWYDDQGVYLVALERPFSSSRNDVVRLVEGAILACLPARVQVWEVTQQQWKPRLGIGQKEKPTAADLRSVYPEIVMSGPDGPVWPQDAFDAAGMAFWARDLNAAIVAGVLADG